ncbi:UNVERIFIED_CONTAM: hypothetical protein RMT77_017371 [Armadillidium vulgare]
MTSKDELACVYAALILLDDDVPITAEKISTILKAANVNVEPYWPGLFAKAAAGLDLRALVSNVGSGVGSGGPAPAAAAGGGGGGGAAAAPAAKEAPKKEEKKEEPEEESDDDMGFGLFD